MLVTTNELGRTAGSRLSLADLPVNAKILLSVGIASLAAVTVGITGLLALSRASASAQHIYTSSVAGVAAVGEVKAAFLQGRVDVTLHAASSGQDAKAKIKETFATDAQAADDAIAAYRKADSAGDPAVIDDLATVWQQYVTIANTRSRNEKSTAIWFGLSRRVRSPAANMSSTCTAARTLTASPRSTGT